GLYFENDGRVRLVDPITAVTTRADAPNNPFQQPVLFRFPTPGFYSIGKERLRTTRITVGMIATLPGRWKANADYAFGRARLRRDISSNIASGELLTALASGVQGPGGRPALDPLGDPTAFAGALASYM